MSPEDIKKLRKHYRVLRGQQRVFEDARTTNLVTFAPVKALTDALARLEAEFPSLVPPFNKGAVLHHTERSGDYFSVQAIRAHLASVVGVLEVEIEQEGAYPVVESRNFHFINEVGLRNIVERDYGEIQRAFVAQCWKSVIVLSGGAIEAILTDLLLADPPKAKNASAAPSKPDIRSWDLAELINVAVELKLVSHGVQKLSHPVREYRNLVHPGNEIRNKLSFGPEEARIALEVLHILHRDLMP